MPLLVNLRHLADHGVSLKGSLSVEELELDSRDEMIQANRPIEYELEVERVNESILVQGEVRIVLDCECSRCLKPCQHEIRLSGLLCELPLQGDDAVAVMNDCVDLTPHLRDDIFLEFPVRPLCKADCVGLPGKTLDPLREASGSDCGDGTPSVWDELNKLKY